MSACVCVVLCAVWVYDCWFWVLCLQLGVVFWGGLVCFDGVLLGKGVLAWSFGMCAVLVLYHVHFGPVFWVSAGEGSTPGG